MAYINPLQPLSDRLAAYSGLPQAPLRDKQTAFVEEMERVGRWALLGLPHSDLRSVRYAFFGPPKGPTT